MSQTDNIREEFKKGETLISWNFPEFIKYDKSARWYVFAVIVTALFLVYSVVTFNFLFAVIIIMVVMIILMREKKEPRKIHFAITNMGILVSRDFFPFKDIRNFSIVYEPPHVKILYLEFKSKLKPRFSALLEDENPNEIRKILKENIEEDLDRTGESITDAMGRWLKF
ncbi:MAG: hypothetical protein V1860_04350 [bacterium]